MDYLHETILLLDTGCYMYNFKFNLGLNMYIIIIM